MDPVQASSVELRAYSGSLASKERERRIPHSSDVTEINSDDQVMKHSPTRSNEMDENEENDWNKRRHLVVEKSRRAEEEFKKREEEITLYLPPPLYRAALKGDWKSAKRILENDPRASTAEITLKYVTVLQVAVSTDGAIKFVEELLHLMPAESLAQTTYGGDTALSFAAKVGNTKAAKLLVRKNPDLPQKRNFMQYTPLHQAAKFGHKETVRFLLSVTRDDEPNPFTGESGVMLLIFFIVADFYDIALDLLKINPKLALYQDKRDFFTTSDYRDYCGETAFMALAQKPQAFASGSQLELWERIIYHCFHVEIKDVPLKPMEGGDMENPIESSQKCSTKFTHHRFLQQISTAFGTLCSKVHVMLWIIFKKLVPSINHIHDAKLMHMQTLQLLKHMCAEVTTLSGANALELLRAPFHTATRLGIHEFVTESIKTHPHLIWQIDRNQVFNLAVSYRHGNIFSLLYQLGSYKHFVAEYMDDDCNNLLHLAGKLVPSNRFCSAALQMQRELQWFKEVEKFVQPSFKEMKNSAKKTPRMVFKEEHAMLVKQGEKWMKETATSCTVVAALIATMVFTAVFTVPGGNESDNGIPIFLNELSFMVFATSDAISLFSSTTSLLMFLGILTSRYSEKDFFKSLPRKLIIGLITLLISIASMVTAFSATFYIVLVPRFNGIAIPIAIFACLPVMLFALLQFPLLVELAHSTYGPSIFHRHSNDIICLPKANAPPPTSVRIKFHNRCPLNIVFSDAFVFSIP